MIDMGAPEIYYEYTVPAEEQGISLLGGKRPKHVTPPVALLSVGSITRMTSSRGDERGVSWTSDSTSAGGSAALGVDDEMPRADVESPDNKRQTTSSATSELRRISGLTWEQLAEMFGVSVRTMHFWASGKALNADNERRLFRVLDVVRSGDQGSARKNRAALLVSEANISALELLRDGRFEEAQARVQVETPATRHLGPKLSPSERAKFTPPPPAELMGALHEPIHQSTGRSRAARSVRSK